MPFKKCVKNGAPSKGSEVYTIKSKEEEEIQIESFKVISYPEITTTKKLNWLGISKQSLAAFISSLSVLMCGNAMGWITPILMRFLSPVSDIPMSPDQSSWVVSFIELGNLFSPLPAGILVDKWGRKTLLLMSAPVYFVSWTIILNTRTVHMLYLVRLIQGFGMGIVFTVLPMYLGEIAEPKIRGFISTFYQGMWYSGILIPYCVGPYVSYQLLNYVMFVTPIVFMLTFIWMPESPYFLLMKKRKREALDSLSWLRGVKLVDAIDELEEIESSVDEEMRNRVCSLTDIFSTKVYRRALLIVMIVSSSEIGSGITAILSYASETFSATEKSFFTPDQYTIIMGVFIVTATFLAAAVVDSMGRRPLLLMSSIGCSILDLIVGIFFFIDKKTNYDISQYSWIAFASITSYCVLLSVGLGPLTTTVQSEFFPANTRGIASGISAMAITVLSFAFLKLYEVITENVGIFLNYILYSLSCLIASVLIYFIVPETKGKSLAEIQILLQNEGCKKKDKKSNKR